MVKNTTGGSGSRGMARKNETSGGKLRLATDPEFEIYAIVTKALGNCMFHVKTITGLDKLILHVRGKFSGRNKRNNFISVGSFVLIGLRDYEKPNYNNCDLLELYSDQEVKRLMTVPSIANSRFFIQTADSLSGDKDETFSGKITDDDFIFSNVEPVTFEPVTVENTCFMVDEEQINIDDI
jgi:translation initiation factor IF-1